MTYHLDGLSIMSGERVVCSAVAVVGQYEKQARELQAMVDVLNAVAKVPSLPSNGAPTVAGAKSVLHYMGRAQS